MDSLFLKLPFLMPSQAQKHVTHNEALAMLDAIVQLAVARRDLTAPPAEPAEGERHIVATGATGEWAGHDGEIAFFADDLWRFFAPGSGWLAWLEAEEQLLIFRDADWHPFFGSYSMLGINTTADLTSRLSVASAASLFSHDGGDHRLAVNKAEEGDTASLLFQSGFAGRAEIGLVGGDDLLVKVSPDGSTFSEAIAIDRASADTRLRSLNSGPLAGLRNAVINGGGAINQRGFAGGSLTGYGYDRWSAEGGGCAVTVAFTLTGAISQTIEASGLSGTTVTVSVDNPDSDLAVTLGSASGAITAGSGRRHVTFDLDISEPDDLKLVVTAAGESSFGDVQVEPGPWPTPFERRPVALEEMLCRRYFEVSHPVFSGSVTGGEVYRAVAPYTVAKRIVPDTTVAAVEFVDNLPATLGSYTASGLSRSTGAHIYFPAVSTSASASVQLKVLADAEF